MFDYHLHSTHSMDGGQTMPELCAAAVRAGLSEICLTEHLELGHPSPGADVPPVMPAFFAELETLRAQYPTLAIRAGIEIGDNPACRDRIRAWLGALPLDFRLLSLHLIDGMDPYDRVFYKTGDQSTLYRRYAEAKLASALAWGFDAYDAFAHIGYCGRYAPYAAAERPLRYAHAPDAFDALLKHLANGGKAVEVNASGYGETGEMLPHASILRRFAELGGTFVTLGSDAHEPAQVGAYMREAAAYAQSCGIRYALTFEKRVPKPVSLEQCFT